MYIKAATLFLWILPIFATITDVRLKDEPTRLELITQTSPTLHIFTLKQPARVVIDVQGTCGPKPLYISKDINNYRQSQFKTGCRLVFETTHEYIANASKPEKMGDKYRTIIGLKPTERTEVMALFDKPSLAAKPMIIAIDAGHGGKDPGAIGVAGTPEKEIVLSLAKKLKKILDADPRYKAVLIRDADHFIPLRDRMNFARKHHADLFISLHADAFNNKSAHGASVYVLSENGASSEAARFIAAHENQADLVGGASLDTKNPILASVLLDLSQNATGEASLTFAQIMLEELYKVTPLHKKTIEKAGFAVLKSPDIPSILIEAGFISNRLGEKRLSDENHQKKLALAIKKGIERFFKDRPQNVSYIVEK